jgi:polar amino acid transport system substrate-binding protein
MKLFRILLLAATTSGFVGMAAADVMDDIKERGTLRVGVKADYRPYGFLDEQGNIVGLEPDLAQAVADDLGVDLELVPVVASNRMQFLEQGRIDLMIATMTDTEERRQVVRIVEPNYYSSGTNVLAPKSSNRSAACRARSTTARPRRSSGPRSSPSPAHRRR